VDAAAILGTAAVPAAPVLSAEHARRDHYDAQRRGSGYRRARSAVRSWRRPDRSDAEPTSATAAVADEATLGGHFKTGHLWTGQNRPFPAAETSDGLPRGLLLAQVGVSLGTPAAWTALEDVSVVEEAVEERGDRRGVAEELSPVIDGPV
jgi:hypothetical protein